MNGLFVSVLLTSSLALATPATASKFHDQMRGRLVQLSSELDQLKRKLHSVPDDKRSGLQSSIDKLTAEWTALDGRLKTLKPRASAVDQKNMKTQVASLEKEFDDTESNYKDRNVGLGDILGF